MINATDLAKRLREWASRLDDACGPHESLVLLDSSADLLESQAVRIAELERENHTLRTFDAIPIVPERFVEDRQKDVAELQAEVERLKEALEEAESHVHFCPVCKEYCKECQCMQSQLAAAQAEVERLKARVDELERERDEALLLVEGPGTLRELANEYGRAMMSEAELLARERRVRQALKNIDGIMPRDSTAQLILGIIRDTLAAVGVDGATTRQTD